MKLLSLLISSSLLFQVATAQINWGLKLGANMNKINATGFSDSFRFNYYGGAFVNIGIKKNFSIQPEVIFGQTSTKTASNFSSIYSGSGASAQSNLKDNKLNFLSIPILATLGKGSVKFQVGPQYSILIDNNKNLLQNGQSAFKNGEFAMVGGVQLNLFGKLQAQGRYVVGLNSISDLSNSNDWKNQSIQLGLAYSF
jgi:hypothetical protein